MHVFGCKPGRKWPFPDLIRDGQLLLLDPQIVSRLQGGGTHANAHSPHHWFKEEENIRLSKSCSASKSPGEAESLRLLPAQHVAGEKPHRKRIHRSPLSDISRHFNTQYVFKSLVKSDFIQYVAAISCSLPPSPLVLPGFLPLL